MLNKPYGTLRLTETTPDGAVVDEHEQEIDSYVVQFLELASAVWGNQEVSGVTDINGNDRTLESGNDSIPPFTIDTAAGGTDRGVQIGDDGTGETVTDNSLANQLTTDVAYSSTAVSSPGTAPPTASLDITRTFTNNTGSSITIREVGVAATHDDSTGTTRYFLCLRDTGSPLQTVADGNNTTVEYEVEITV